MRAAIVIVALSIASTVAAQPADVPGMIKFVDTQPSDMDRSTWKEKRRDVTRKLGQSKDKRATPLLMRLAETETFDVIGDIAIEGLGTLGDQSAVPTLQRVLADASRDKSSRELAKKSLNKLGAP
jgi:HEAT repeat protein